jgi:hypothetical protein
MTEEKEVAEVAAVQDEQQQIPQEEVKQPEAPKVDAQAENWKKANEILSLQKKKIEELEYRLQEMAKPPPVEEKDEFADLDPEAYLNVTQARALAEKLAEKKAKQTAMQVVQQYAQQQNIANDETRTRAKYEDYDYVVENFAIPLLKNDPALAHKIQSSKNPAETAYRLGMLSDEYQASQQKQETSPKAEKILKNSQRPVSSNAVGAPLKAQVDNFSKMSKQEIWAMSERFAKGGV